MVLLQRYAQTIVTICTAGLLIYGGLTHFATAGDVDKKFKEVSMKIDATSARQNRDRYEDELFRLRQQPASDVTQALIRRYESKLEDVNARLRDLEKKNESR